MKSPMMPLAAPVGLDNSVATAQALFHITNFLISEARNFSSGLWRRIALGCLLLIFPISCAWAQQEKPQPWSKSFREATVNNAEPRRDADGEILDAFWSPPSQFDTTGNVLPTDNVPAWRADVLTDHDRPHPIAIYSWPKKRDPNPLKTDPCTGKPIVPGKFDGMSQGL